MIRKTAIWLVLIGVIIGVVFMYTFVMRYFGSGEAPEMVPPAEQATLIVVDKSERSLTLFRDDQKLMTVPVSLGDAPEGHKVKEGDERTPTGTYEIDWRNPDSVAHLSMHISYPNADDKARAAEMGVSPGGNIMIHGIANGWGALGKLHRYWDWTNGCIAVTNKEIKQVWSLVPDGTPIQINE
ncbi:L,D-transpeptidase family protein [Sulfitobacter sp. F26169L]|uniref:L,D-transpeptidase family protein n=1 Tax=Sulfitobacter sp. F26169L TaxID=2996015 RepID=UPI002260F1A8|nr:L,D-transpeptidase family protein [Sulfitobacter sp. F26169L]MCX7567240.1 L,D-transpeptidase family protein [Sulfitobacter sp. F26169L]